MDFGCRTDDSIRRDTHTLRLAVVQKHLRNLGRMQNGSPKAASACHQVAQQRASFRPSQWCSRRPGLTPPANPCNSASFRPPCVAPLRTPTSACVHRDPDAVRRGRVFETAVLRFGRFIQFFRPAIRVGLLLGVSTRMACRSQSGICGIGISCDRRWCVAYVLDWRASRVPSTEC